MILKALSSLNTALKVATGEGSYRLDPVHLDLIAAVSSKLSTEDSHTISRQLEHFTYVAWMSSGRVNRVFYRDDPSAPNITSTGFQDALYRCKVRICDKIRSCNVVFYKGRILDIEMPLKRKLWRNQPYEILGCEKTDPRRSFTRSIDRAEHGRDAQ